MNVVSIARDSVDAETEISVRCQKNGPNQKVRASHNREASRLEDVGSEDPFPGIAPGTHILIIRGDEQENSIHVPLGFCAWNDVIRFSSDANTVVNR